MRAYLKRMVFVVMVTVVFIIISVLCIGLTATSKSYITKQEQERYYREQEKEYVKKLRTYLEDMGYTNSGVTLTRITESDGFTTYTATIHHPAIDRLADADRKELLNQLARLPIPKDDASICHKFLPPNH